MNKRATEYNLNDEQFEQLKTAYINTILDSMSMKDLYEYVYQDYENDLENYTLLSLIWVMTSIKQVILVPRYWL